MINYDIKTYDAKKMKLDKPEIKKVTIQIKDSDKSKALTIYDATVENVYDKIVKIFGNT